MLNMSEDPTQNLPQNGLRQILARLDSIDARLTTLEEKVDRRLQETRPIWEQVLARLDSLEGEVRTGFRKIERQIGTLAKDVLEVRADQRDLEERIDRLEPKPTQ
jgi:chromosome segregation ATPase